MMKRPATLSGEGQSLVIVTLLLFALMGMLALALDGGNGFFQRRRAQNAADAGAMAGARELCVVEGDLPTKQAAAEAAALEYAIDRNGALDATVTFETGIVTVDTVITFPTTFGNVLGQPELVAHAVAAAGCMTPDSGTGVLPIAWACDPTVPGSDSDLCAIAYGEEVTLLWGNTTEEIHCLPEGTIDCDTNDDGINDIAGDGDRSWLNLDGGSGGTAEMNCWIVGCDPDLNVSKHWWLPSKTGVANSAYQTVYHERLGDNVIIPVFDHVCEGDPLTYCPSDYDDPAPDPYTETTIGAGGATSTLYFHIIGFALFHVVCVKAPGAQSIGQCPAPSPGVGNNQRWITGYFVRDYTADLHGGTPSDGADLGAYNLLLTR